MKGTDRIILVVLPIVALAVGFWLLVLSPKMKEACDLDDRIDDCEGRHHLRSRRRSRPASRPGSPSPATTRDLVSLGAAAPEDEDQATLINDFADRPGPSRSASAPSRCAPGTGGTAAEAPAAATTPTGHGAALRREPVAAPAMPTEAAAATLPIGATVGSAGLPVTPYSLTYSGDFFDMADLFASIDDRVDVQRRRQPADVHGRLITIDGFALIGDPLRGFPRVQANLSVTNYLVPAEQGIAAGATPAGPAPVGSPERPYPSRPIRARPRRRPHR